jgi:Fe-S cluster assembly iron-binding protein IscA
MIRVTPSAEERLQELLLAHEATPEQGVRLTPDGKGGLGLAIAAPREGDLVIERDDAPLLIVDGRVVEALDDKVIDYRPVEANGQTTRKLTVHEP